MKMKKLISTLLVLVMLLSVASCAAGVTVDQTQAIKKTPASKSSLALTPLSATDNSSVGGCNIPLVASGVGAASIVLPENASRNVLYAKDRLIFGVEALTGVTLGVSQTENTYEILIGDTGRSESTALKATLSGDGYALKVVGNKIVAVASNDAYLYEAIDLLVETYLTSTHAAVSETAITLTTAIDVTNPGDATSTLALFSQGSNYLTAPTEAILTMDRYSEDVYRKQGGCTDGTYFYQAFLSLDESVARICKRNIATGEAQWSEELSLGHANDVTYNTKTNKLIVYNNADGYKATIINPETLVVEESVTLPVSISSIAYNEERDVYVVCSGSTYRTLDANFALTDDLSVSINPIVSSLVKQGIGCDDHFIYAVLCNSGYSYNIVAVYDWYGNYVGLIDFAFPGNYEPENVDVLNGELVVLGCDSTAYGRVYKITPNDAVIVTDLELLTSRVVLDGNDTTLKIRYTLEDGTTEVIDVEDYMITEGIEKLKMSGTQTIRIEYLGYSEEFSIGVTSLMVYYEDFANLSNTATVSDILTETGWQILVKEDSASSLASVNSALSGTDHVVAGLATGANMANLSISDGRLYVDNSTYNTAATEAYFRVLTDEYMQRCVTEDYTIQYDVELDTSSDAWMSMISNMYINSAKTKLSYFAAKLSPVGYMKHTITYAGTDRDITGNSVVAKGGSATDPQILTRVFGLTEGDLAGRKMTVRIIFVQRDSVWSKTEQNTGLDTAASLGWGFHVYIKPEGASDFTLAAQFNPTKSEASTYYYGGTGELLNRTLALGMASGAKFYIDNIAIWTGVGEAPANTSTDAYENIDKSMMVYYENFNRLSENDDMAEILEALGWRLPVLNNSTTGGLNTNNTKTLAENLASIDGVDLTPFALVGQAHRPNYITVSAESGRLYVDNKTYNNNGAGTYDGYLRILPDGYLDLCEGEDYTIQYDLEFAASTGGGMVMAPKFYAPEATASGSNANRPHYLAARINMGGTFQHSIRISGGTYKTVSTAESPTNILTTVFPEATSLVGQKMTVKIEMLAKESDTDTEWGFKVYVKPEGAADFTFVSEFDTAATYASYFTSETNLDSNALAMVVLTGSQFYIDNIAVWTGLGEMPTDTSVAEYASRMGDMMVYNEDFSELSDTDAMDDILATLGWKLPVLNNSTTGGLNTNNTKTLAENLASIDGVDLTPFAMLGGAHRPNYIAVSAQSGRLYVDNKTYNNNGAGTYDGYLHLLPSEYLELCALGDYTIEYDLEFAASSGGGVVMAPKFYAPEATASGSNANRPHYLAARFNMGGTFQHAIRISGGSYQTVSTSDSPTSILSTVFPEASSLVGQKMTVRIEMLAKDSDSDTEWGYNVYVKPEGASEWTFVSSFNTSATYASYYTSETNLASDALAMVVLTGSQFYVDNIAVWTGTGARPESSTEIYEVLRAAHNAQ